jgi:hypothetical protein
MSSQSQEESYAIPKEHMEFAEEFNSLLKKFPESALRYKLADMGKHDMAHPPIIWKCRELNGVLECRPVFLD